MEEHKPLPKEYVPLGYVPLMEWLKDECARRGFDPTDFANNTQYSQAYDDMANFLAGYDNPDRKLALCITDSGYEIPVRVEYWRSRARDRFRAALGRISFSAGGGSSDKWEGRPVLRADMQLDPASLNAAPAVNSRVRGGRPPKWDWEQGISDVWAHIYSSSGPAPTTIAEITRLLQDKMAKADDSPSESEAKQRARMIHKSLKETA